MMSGWIDESNVLLSDAWSNLKQIGKKRGIIIILCVYFYVCNSHYSYLFTVERLYLSELCLMFLSDDNLLLPSHL